MRSRCSLQEVLVLMEDVEVGVVEVWEVETVSSV